MKRIIALLMALITIVALTACSGTTDGTTEGTNETSADGTNETSADGTSTDSGRDFVECSIDFPTLLDDGGLQYGSGMAVYYDVTTLEDILKGGINGRTEAVFDDEGNLIELGGIKAEGGNYFMYSTFNEQNRYEVLDKKPSEIILSDYASYAIKLVDENGMEVSHIS